MVRRRVLIRGVDKRESGLFFMTFPFGFLKEYCVCRQSNDKDVQNTTQKHFLLKSCHWKQEKLHGRGHLATIKARRYVICKYARRTLGLQGPEVAGYLVVSCL